jgi:hypothetical protein
MGNIESLTTTKAAKKTLRNITEEPLVINAANTADVKKK